MICKWYASDLDIGNRYPKVDFLSKCDHFLASCASIFNPCLDRKVHTYATEQKLANMGFRLNSENMKDTFGIKVTLILEIKLQKTFLAK